MSGGNSPFFIESFGLEPGPDIDTFLLIHGYGGSTFSWRYWAPRLAEQGHVVMIDLKGFGFAEKPDDGQYRPEDQAELVCQLIATRNLRKVTIVGHSLGGGIALLTALRLKDSGSARIERLVIVSGAAYKQRFPPFIQLAKWPILISFIFRMIGTHRIIRWVLRSMVHDPSAVTEMQVNGYAAPLQSEGAIRSLMETARQIGPPNLEQLVLRYPELTVPALLLWGKGDSVVPLAVGQQLVQALPDAHLHVLNACGHMPAEELPEESFAVLSSFLEGSGPRA